MFSASRCWGDLLCSNSWPSHFVLFVAMVPSHGSSVFSRFICFLFLIVFPSFFTPLCVFLKDTSSIFGKELGIDNKLKIELRVSLRVPAILEASLWGHEEAWKMDSGAVGDKGIVSPQYPLCSPLLIGGAGTRIQVF